MFYLTHAMVSNPLHPDEGNETDMLPKQTQAAGYASLAQLLGFEAAPHYRTSAISPSRRSRVEVCDGFEEHSYPSSYLVEQALGPQLEFALKYDGVSLEILRQVFEACDEDELSAWIRSKPQGMYTRRVWFFFEWLMGRQLDIDDASRWHYIDALDPDHYHCAKPVLSARHKVRDNLLGTPSFCPIVRRVEDLPDSVELKQKVDQIVARYDPALWRRASQYLYVKETRSSFEIERERPNQKRTLRFVELLTRAGAITALDEATLVALQNSIVEPRYAESSYRTDQNYVGQTLGYRDLIHYVCPRPEDVPALMDGLAACHARLAESEVDPIVWATVIAFGFVFIHPFLDGNGRLHRFLIHQILVRGGVSPRDTVLPVSATMLAEAADYDRCLESFSSPRQKQISYEVDHQGRMTVKGETAPLYRYFDATRIHRYLVETIRKTIDEAFVPELEYLQRFDQAWRALREIVDMPDQKLNLFIRLCLANKGRLSGRKRSSQFEELSDDEVVAMEQALQDSFPSL